MRKRVMADAWKIAREGQKKFGGKVSEYLSESLKMSWAYHKSVHELTLPLTEGYEPYVKLITGVRGSMDKFHLSTQPVLPKSSNGDLKYLLRSGNYYIAKKPLTNSAYLKVVEGEVEFVSLEEVFESVPKEDERLREAYVYLQDSVNNPSYVARLGEYDEKYGIERQFISFDVRPGVKKAVLLNGNTYEVRELGVKRYFVMEGGVLVETNKPLAKKPLPDEGEREVMIEYAIEIARGTLESIKNDTGLSAKYYSYRNEFARQYKRIIKEEHLVVIKSIVEYMERIARYSDQSEVS